MTKAIKYLFFAVSIFLVGCKKEELKDESNPDLIVSNYSETQIEVGESDTTYYDINGDGEYNFKHIRHITDKGSQIDFSSKVSGVNYCAFAGNQEIGVQISSDNTSLTWCSWAGKGGGTTGAFTIDKFYPGDGIVYAGFRLYIGSDQYYGWLKMKDMSLIKVVISKIPETPINVGDQ